MVSRSLAVGLVWGLYAIGRLTLAAEHRAANVDEFDTAVRTARPGDTIVLASGRWQDADLLFATDGTPTAPITLRAETPGETVLCGQSRLRFAGVYLVADGLKFTEGHHEEAAVAFRHDPRRPAHYCRLTNTAIVDYNPPATKKSSVWIALYGTHNRVDHCYLSGKANPGATLAVWLSDAPNNHRIDHNHFGPRPELGDNGGETIRVGDSRTSMQVSRTIIEHNLFRYCDGEAEIISNKSCENIYRYNTFRDCSGALTLRHGNRCLVEGNFFLGGLNRGVGGVRIVGEDHRVVNNYFAELSGDDARAAISIMTGIPQSPANGYFQVKGLVLAFNTCVDCKQTLLIGLSDKDQPRQRLPPKDCLIANNLLVNRSGLVVDERTSLAGITWQGNQFMGLDPGLPGERGLQNVTVTMTADGLMLRPAEDDPPRGAAEGDFAWVTEDIEGHRRGEMKDVGCDQWSDAPPLRRPLRPDDVGPPWHR